MAKRECGSCTKCCEGHLAANIKGHQMYPGKPCFFVEIGKGCKEYNSRPAEPCRNYICYWKLNQEVPKRFKPEHSGVLMNWYEIEGMNYIDIVKAPNEVTVEILSWAVLHARINNLNIKWTEADRIHWFGSEEFCTAMLNKLKSATNPSDRITT